MDQNGPGTGSTHAQYTIETYDPIGNLIEYRDERGTITKYIYERLGQASQQIVNYQTSGSGPGINITTDFTYDSLRRLYQTCINKSNQVASFFLRGYCVDLGKKLGIPLDLATNRPHLFLSDEEKKPLLEMMEFCFHLRFGW